MQKTGSALILKLARNVFFAILASISFIIMPIILFMSMNKHVKEDQYNQLNMDFRDTYVQMATQFKKTTSMKDNNECFLLALESCLGILLMFGLVYLCTSNLLY